MSLKANSQKAPSVKGLNYWRKELLSVSLPALSSTGSQLRNQIKKPESSLRDIEEIIAKAAVL